MPADDLCLDLVASDFSGFNIIQNRLITTFQYAHDIAHAELVFHRSEIGFFVFSRRA